MAKLKKPEFIKMPPLYEENTATVAWENMPETDRYELDMVCNDDFDTAGHGITWTDIEINGWDWSGQEGDSLTWHEIEKQPARGLMWRNLEFCGKNWEEWEAEPEKNWQWMQKKPVVFTVYSGPGEDIPAPDQGLKWENIDNMLWSWNAQEEEQAHSWEEFEQLSSVGMTWSQHDHNEFVWEEFEDVYLSWRDLEHQPARGLSWYSMMSRWLTWQGFETCGADDEGLTWKQLCLLPADSIPHKGTEVELPLYSKSSMTRVRAIDRDGNPGPYLTTDLLKHRPRSLAGYQPPCLHSPYLFEGAAAEIIWGELYGASGYVVERRLSGGRYEVVYDGPGRPVAHPQECDGPMTHWYGPDCKRHFSFTDRIPYHEKTAQYRIRGYNTTDSSRYLELEEIEIVPVFLYVPDLYEESTGTISWKKLKDIDQYELDMVFNEDFESAKRGWSWADIGLDDWTWDNQEKDTGFTWNAMEKLPAQGLMWRNLEFHKNDWEQWEAQPEKTWQWMQKHPMVFTIYKGPGEDVPAPDQGLAWSNMDGRDWNWAYQESSAGLSWRAATFLPSVGLTWGQHDGNRLIWEEVEDTYTSWNVIENLPTRGLSWGSLMAKWLAWKQIETAGDNKDGITWHELDHLPPDNEAHRGVELDIPLYTKSSMYRMRVFNNTNSLPGEHLTTALVGHRPRSIAKYRTPCLHVPTLYEGKTAELVWGELYGASGYIVERKLSGGSYQVVYNGPGREVAHPEGCNSPIIHWYGPDCKRHLAFTDTIPYYEKTAQYRIRGYNTTDSSQILELSAVRIVPVFVRDDNNTVSAVQNDLFSIQLQVSDVERFENIQVTLEYDASVLDPVNLQTQNLYGIATGAAKDVQLRILSTEKGRLKFTCTKTTAQAVQTTSYVTLCTFRGLQNRNTVVRLY